MNSTKAFYSQSFQTFSHDAKLSTMVTDCGREVASQVMNVSSSQQHIVIRRSSRHSACSSSSRSSGSETDNAVSMSVPPPIPEKTRHHHHLCTSHLGDRAQSHYDNVDNISSSEKLDVKHLPQVKVPDISCISNSASSSTSELGSSKSSMTSWESTTSNSSPASSSVIQRRYKEAFSTHSNRRSNAEKPPLPPKQRHIMEYMQIFKDYQMPEKEWFQHRRSQQILSSYQTESVNLGDDFKEFELDTHGITSRFSLPYSAGRHSPPALPPKRKSRSPDCHQRTPSDIAIESNSERNEYLNHPEICSCHINKEGSSTSSSSNYLQPPKSPSSIVIRTKDHLIATNEKNDAKTCDKSSREMQAQEFVEDVESDSLLDCLNVNEHITFQGESEESDVKSGSVDALVVYATYSKNGTYLEAFLTTYRTFLTPAELIVKLFYRYNKFVCRSSTEYQKAAKNAFSLLVRVVHDLVVTELTEELLKDLAQFEYNLLSKGDLKLALYFRKKLSEKLKLWKNHQEQAELSCHYLTIKNQQQFTLLDFKSNEIADQMTLLDSELFSKFGIPELLHYSRDQDEEHCPNLAEFAMQINRMSSWVKTLILKSNSQDREKYYKKFIKIMKHLRKVNNNYNSCIAILSGLESADVRRLDWPKASMDMLKEYCDLFDFEGSYRAYRQALAETKPPCIPHLGIILQDLTKLYHINPNHVDGKVNFLKRWLQFNILEDMKRFIPSKYDIRKNESIRNFINNYEDCMSDSDLWDLSLAIKPKAKPK